MECCVVFKGRRVECLKGDTVLNVLRNAGIFIDAPCSGNGKCGKCRVRIVGKVSKITENELKLLGKENVENGIRLACETKVLGECTAEPVSNENTEIGVCEDGEGEPFTIDPSVKSVVISLKPAGLENQISQHDNLKESLGKKGIDIDEIPLKVIKKAGGHRARTRYMRFV